MTVLKHNISHNLFPAPNLEQIIKIYIGFVKSGQNFESFASDSLFIRIELWSRNGVGMVNNIDYEFHS